jgi:hypothetical protein
MSLSGDIAMSAFSPPLCFVGVMDWQVIQMAKDLSSMIDWWEVGRWAAIIVLSLFVYAVLVIKIWSWIMSRRGEVLNNRDDAEQKKQDEEEVEYIREWRRKREEKKRGKR